MLADPTLKAKTDNAPPPAPGYRRSPRTSRRWTTSTAARPSLLPTSKTGYQRAYGGTTGGDIATSLLPPMPGHDDFDLYDLKETDGNARGPRPSSKCGKPNGFTTNIASARTARRRRPTAESLQQSLAKVGIKRQHQGLPAGDYSSCYAGMPDFAKANEPRHHVYGWGADWPDGFGFLDQIVDGRTSARRATPTSA